MYDVVGASESAGTAPAAMGFGPGLGRIAHNASVSTDAATTATDVHWLPVSPKNRLSTRRKSVRIRALPYQMAHVMIMTPSRRGFRFITMQALAARLQAAVPTR